MRFGEDPVLNSSWGEILLPLAMEEGKGELGHCELRAENRDGPSRLRR
jgi:hypothetical protein